MAQTTTSQQSEPAWLVKQREQSTEACAKLDMPRLKYGLTIKIDLEDFSFDACLPVETPEKTIVCPKGVDVLDFSEAIKKYPDLIEKKFMTAVSPTTKNELFHAAHWKKAVVIVVPQDFVSAEPIEINTVFKDTLVESVLVIAEPNSGAIIIDTTTNNGTKKFRLHSKIVEIFAGQGSTVRFLSLQNCDEETHTFVTKRAITENDAAVNWLDCQFGSKICVSETTTFLKGSGSSSNNYGLFFGRGTQKFDIHAKTVHEGQNTSSDMLTKGVLDDSAKAIYRGVLKMLPSAGGASGYQKEDVTLLSPKAEADSIPELRIHNNDIKKCTHGASIGQVDNEKLFYVMSRGFSKKEAIKKLIEAFFASMFNKAANEKFTGELQKLIEEKLYEK